jgi:HNH endonuclease
MSDTIFKISPALWSVDVLVSHGHRVVTDVARDAAASSSTMRYLLGRCLLALERLGTYKEMGLSSCVHFATQHLKMNKRAVQTILRVSRKLEELPMLGQAVLRGEIEWSQIREVVSVATVDTEEMWRDLCHKFNCKQIQDLVTSTPAGGVPGEVASKLPRKTSEYRCRFQPEVMVLIERGLQMMSQKVGKPIMFREAVERFFTEFLADKPYDEAEEKMLEVARKDFLAGKIQQEPLVQKAREVARVVGVLQDMEEAKSETASEHQTPEEKALRALDHLQQAVGGELPWDLEDGDQPPQMGTSNPDQSSHVGTSNPDQPSHVGTSDPDQPSHAGFSNSDQQSHPGNLRQGLRPCPEPSKCNNSHTNGPTPEAQTGRPAPKVTPLRSPFSNQPNQSRFEPQSPTLLKELMARLRFNPDARFPTKAQRKALLRRDRYCCRTPGCTNHLFLEIHHVIRYSQGGKTLPRFLVTLCSRCHKNTEEGKLLIQLTESGELVFTDRYGNDLEEVQRQERAIWLDYWLGWQGKETDSHWARAMGFSKAA